MKLVTEAVSHGGNCEPRGQIGMGERFIPHCVSVVLFFSLMIPLGIKN